MKENKNFAVRETNITVRGDKEISHPIFLRMLEMMRGRGFTVGSDPRIDRDYAILSKDHFAGSKGDLIVYPDRVPLSKNAEEIKSTYDFSPPPQDVLENMAEAYRNLNGTEVVGAVWGYSPDGYSLYGWEDNDDEKFKEFIYAIEQDAMFGSYIDDRERFDADWESGKYEPAAAMHFDKNDFVILEKIERKSLAEGDQSTE